MERRAKILPQNLMKKKERYLSDLKKGFLPIHLYLVGLLFKYFFKNRMNSRLNHSDYDAEYFSFKLLQI